MPPETTDAGRGGDGGSAGYAVAGGGAGGEVTVEGAAKPSTACGVVSGAAPDGAQTLENNGKARMFIVRVPPTYNPKTPLPVLFLFHGATGTASNYDKSSNFKKDLGDKAVLVFPEALVSPQTNATTWMRDAPDDLAFFDGVVAWVESKVCVDTSRIFAAGHSSGGFFSNTVGCQRGNVVRGIGPVSGGPREMKNCMGTVAAWVAHGTKDTNIAIATGMEGRDFWLDRNTCSADPPTPTSPAPCVAYSGCRDGYPVQWCAFDGGHVWPSFANLALWDFFSKL